ncbi:MAG TPA: sigma-70 family RNA polymerase sigma factor [Gaiellaceae bacterium]|nr:sigma-70 family RNA polymerase sigma factor [Gaiellaceae bacterium]
MSRRSASTDEELLVRVAAGDDGALALLYDRHGAAAFALARRIVGDALVAEDAVQEAFLAVWRDVRRFDPGRGCARTWLLVLVQRRALDALRRERRRRRDVDAPPRPAPAAADVAWAALQRERVRAALAVLPAARRELLALAS